jgi:Immunity protein 21
MATASKQARAGAGTTKATPAKPAKRHFIGSPHWTSGPLCLLSRGLHDAWASSFGDADGKRLAAVKGAVSTASFGREEVLVMGNSDEIACVEAEGALWLVGVKGETTFTHVEVRALLKNAPLAELSSHAFTTRARVRLGGESVLCNAWAKSSGARRERQRAIALGLPPGHYEIATLSRAQPASLSPHKPVKVTYRVIRIAPAGETPAFHHDGRRGGPPVLLPPPAITPAVVAMAKKLRFIETAGGPSVALPREALSSWTGTDTVGGRCDYDRSCEVNDVGVLPAGPAEALVFGSPDAIAFHPTDGGGLFIQWLGADSAAGCLAAALAVPEQSFKKARAKLDVTGAGKFVLFDSGQSGRKLGRRAGHAFQLAPGRYAIAAAWGYEADVTAGTKTEATSVNVVRLTLEGPTASRPAPPTPAAPRRPGA